MDDQPDKKNMFYTTPPYDVIKVMLLVVTFWIVGYFIVTNIKDRDASQRALLFDPGDSTAIGVSITTGTNMPVNRSLFGVGYSNEEVIASQDMHLDVGESLDELNIGFIRFSDISDTEIVIKQAQTSGAGVMFTGDVMHSTPTEVLAVLSKIKSANISKIRFEAGGALYDQTKLDDSISVEEYIGITQSYIESINSFDQTISIGVPVASVDVLGESKDLFNEGVGEKYFKHWNNTLAEAKKSSSDDPLHLDFDAYIVHDFPVLSNTKAEGCDEIDGNSEILQDMFACASHASDMHIDADFSDAMEYYTALFGKTKVWITAWNYNTEQSAPFLNTLLHTQYAVDYLNILNEYNAIHFPVIDGAMYSALASPSESDLLSTLGSVSKDGTTVSKRSAYFGFDLMEEIFTVGYAPVGSIETIEPKKLTTSRKKELSKKEFTNKPLDVLRKQKSETAPILEDSVISSIPLGANVTDAVERVREEPTRFDGETSTVDTVRSFVRETISSGASSKTKKESSSDVGDALKTKAGNVRIAAYVSPLDSGSDSRSYVLYVTNRTGSELTLAGGVDIDGSFIDPDLPVQVKTISGSALHATVSTTSVIEKMFDVREVLETDDTWRQVVFNEILIPEYSIVAIKIYGVAPQMEVARVIEPSGERLIVAEGAISPLLLSSGITTSFNGLYDTNNDDMRAIVSDMGINMFRYLLGVESNYAHWDGPGMGMSEQELTVFKALETKAEEFAFTSKYNGTQDGIPYTRFHDKLVEISKTAARQPVVTYALNIMTQDSRANPQTPVALDSASIDLAIDENIALIQNLIDNGIVVDTVQLCSECLAGRYNNAFPTVEHFVARIKPIAQAIKNEFPDVVIQLHIGIPDQSVDFGINTIWNRGLRDANATDMFFDEIGTYLWLDGVEYLDKDCNPANNTTNPSFNMFVCAKDKSRSMLDGRMQSIIDTYSSYFGGLPVQIEQMNINNYDQSGVVSDFTGAAFENTFVHTAFIGEYLFKLAHYNADNNNIVRSSSIMNFSGQIKNLLSKAQKNTEDESLPDDELYGAYYKPNALKLNASGLAYKLASKVFDGAHGVIDIALTVPESILKEDIQMYGFRNLNTGEDTYYIFNWSSTTVDLESLAINGAFIKNPTTTMNISTIGGSKLSSSYGRKDENHNEAFTMMYDDGPTSVIGTSNVSLPKFSISKIEGLSLDSIVTVPTGTLTVNNIVINDDGGEKTEDDFALFAGASSITSNVPVVLPVGTYTISETHDTAYVITFSGACDSNGQVTIVDGESSVCTITNDDVVGGGTVTVTNIVINDDGGAKSANDFDLTVGATSVIHAVPATFAPGTYTVSVANTEGYTMSFSGACNSSGVITVISGEHKICTVTNNDTVPATGMVTVVKMVINDDGGTKSASDFGLKVGTTTVVNNIPVNIPVGTYIVSETNTTGYMASFSGACNSSGSITVTANENITCTITNNDTAGITTGTITITTVVINNNGGEKTVSDFPLALNGASITSGTPLSLSVGTYEITASNTSGYITSFAGDCTNDGMITVLPAKSLVCTATQNDTESNIPPIPPVIEDEKQECSDNQDNDNDGYVDFPVDKGCTDSNDTSEDSDVDEKVQDEDIVPQQDYEDNIPVVPDITPVMPSSTCLPSVPSPAFTQFLQFGMVGNPEVMRLQQLLKTLGYFSSEPTGNFYEATETSVRMFQTAYAIDSLGIVGPLTRAKLNELYSMYAVCSGSNNGSGGSDDSASDVPSVIADTPVDNQPTNEIVFTRSLFFGLINNSEVRNLQILLKELGYFTAEPTGSFFFKTQSAVIDFQKTYAIQQLGIVGPITRAKLNQLWEVTFP